MHLVPSKVRFPYLQQYLTKPFARQLPDDAFHLQVKERSQNFAEIQPRRFDKLVNMPWFLGTEQLKLSFRCI
jgi:hypothetical protein